MNDDEKMYTVVTINFPNGVQDISVEMPEGLNKEESRVYALGASEGVLAFVRHILGEENLIITTTGWDETNLPEDGTMGLSPK